MSQTTFSHVKTVSNYNYLKPFKNNSKLQGWDWGKLYTKKSTKRATERVFSYSGLPVAARTGELQTANYGAMHEQDATTFTVYKYTLATLFSQELLDDNQHLPDFMKEAGSNAGDSHSFARDVAAAAFLNNAFDSDYDMYDGVELCGTHYMQDGTTFNNELTASSLSWDNVWEGVSKFETSLVSHEGFYLNDTPKYLIYHPSKEKLVRKILRTDKGKPGTADNDKNTLRDYNLIPVQCRHLTTSTYWFLAGSRFPKNNLWFTRKKLTLAREKDFDRDGVKFKSTERWARGVRDYMYIFGNTGA